jgi:hypothetical protein
MDRLRTTCPTCGAPHTLDPAAVVLHISDGLGYYLFGCDRCGELAFRGVTGPSTLRMVRAGVALVEVDPDPGGEAEDALPGLPPLTLDDLLDLHLALASDGWLDALLADRAEPGRS